ncbi:hypothetical protein PLANPX_2044 [Lacipirellula parvula]|uniref:Uncharacterized protein n=1 Tax=Lacipirellula parvula TaxID=2650471 RepID=A0A5K7X982_9BACT|nr:hypothetical protein PLANPX_2044 [Lacipirellula parvula]
MESYKPRTAKARSAVKFKNYRMEELKDRAENTAPRGLKKSRDRWSRPALPFTSP